MNPQDKSPPRDFRAEVTADIIKMLENGTAPWQKSWDAGELGRSPFNPTTGKAYRGGNILSLMISSMRRGYTDPRFCTFKQAQAEDWHVKKGEKAQYVEFWDVKPGDKEALDENGKRSKMIHRTYAVFNAAQMDGIPLIELPERKPFKIIESAETLLKNSGAEIRHGGGKAYYSPSADFIQMPPRECFVDEPHYYATCLHELAHWSGAKKRLARLKDGATFGTPDYAHEEIVADLASLMMSSELGIPYDPKDQASYIGHWIEVLKKDKNEVFRAAAEASKVCDYLYSLENGKIKPTQLSSQTERITDERARQHSRAR